MTARDFGDNSFGSAIVTLFWIFAGLLALAVAFVLAWSLLRPRRERLKRAAEYDLAVYKAQLAEVDRDLARGVIAEDEAERARIEIKRRMLEADRALSDADRPADGQKSRKLRLVAAAIGGLVVLGGSVLLYQRIGAPGLPDLPHDKRLADIREAAAKRPSQEEAEASAATPPPPAEAPENYIKLVERLRTLMKDRPDDLNGQRLLARHEATLGNFKAAWRAQARVVDLLGPDKVTAEDLADLAELMILAAGGYVSPEAEKALVAALKRDPADPRARYYTGLLLVQTGRPDLAVNMWSRLARESPPDAPWMPLIREQLPQAAAMAGIRPSQLPDLSPPPGKAPFATMPGPSSEDVAAAQQMSAEDRQAMIRSMVNRLETRLTEEGGTAQEWARLIRAKSVLGDMEGARKSYAAARRALAGDAAGLTVVEKTAASVGVKVGQ